MTSRAARTEESAHRRVVAVQRHGEGTRPAYVLLLADAVAGEVQQRQLAIRAEQRAEVARLRKMKMDAEAAAAKAAEEAAAAEAAAAEAAAAEGEGEPAAE